MLEFSYSSMSSKFLVEARNGLPKIAQRLSIIPVALTALARFKPEYAPAIDHYQFLRQFSEIQDGVNNYLMPEAQPFTSPHWFLGTANMRHGFFVGVSYDKKEKALTFICAHARKYMQMMTEEDVGRAARSVTESDSRSALDSLRSSADVISTIRLVEKAEGIEIIASAEGEKTNLLRPSFAENKPCFVSYNPPSSVTHVKPLMDFTHGVISQLVDEAIARKMIYIHHPYLYR